MVLDHTKLAGLDRILTDLDGSAPSDRDFECFLSLVLGLKDLPLRLIYLRSAAEKLIASHPLFAFECVKISLELDPHHVDNLRLGARILSALNLDSRAQVLLELADAIELERKEVHAEGLSQEEVHSSEDKTADAKSGQMSFPDPSADSDDSEVTVITNTATQILGQEDQKGATSGGVTLELDAKSEGIDREVTASSKEVSKKSSDPTREEEAKEADSSPAESKKSGMGEPAESNEPTSQKVDSSSRESFQTDRNETQQADVAKPRDLPVEEETRASDLEGEDANRAEQKTQVVDPPFAGELRSDVHQDRAELTGDTISLKREDDSEEILGLELPYLELLADLGEREKRSIEQVIRDRIRWNESRFGSGAYVLPSEHNGGWQRVEQSLQSFFCESDQHGVVHWELLKALYELGLTALCLTIFRSCSMSQKSPYAWGLFIDCLVAEGQCYVALHEIYKTFEETREVGWAHVAYPRLRTIWSRVGLKGFDWDPILGLEVFVSSLLNDSTPRFERTAI